MMHPAIRKFPRGVAFAILLCAFAGACSQSGSGQAAAVAPQAEVPQEAPTSDIASSFREGMAYGALRGELLAGGWEPVVQIICREAVVGDDADAMCAADPDLRNCGICEALPELQSCSSDARCLMRFRHAGDRTELDVRTRGDVGAWEETGDDAQLQVSDWELVTLPQD